LTAPEKSVSSSSITPPASLHARPKPPGEGNRGTTSDEAKPALSFLFQPAVGCRPELVRRNAGARRMPRIHEFLPLFSTRITDPRQLPRPTGGGDRVGRDSGSRTVSAQGHGLTHRQAIGFGKGSRDAVSVVALFESRFPNARHLTRSVRGRGGWV
jgi:hypothetical protein